MYSFQERIRRLRERELRRMAGACVLARGCDRLRLEEVAAACGVARSTIYLHFSNRDGLVQAAVAELDRALATRLARPPGELDPRGGLRWAILEVLEAKLLCHRLAAAAELPDLAAVRGQVWPCCRRWRSCPYGGGQESLRAIDRLARGVPQRPDTPLPVPAAAMLLVQGLPRLATTAGLRAGVPVRWKEIQAAAARLLELLV